MCVLRETGGKWTPNFVLKIVLGRLAYALGKENSTNPFCLSEFDLAITTLACFAIDTLDK